MSKLHPVSQETFPSSVEFGCKDNAFFRTDQIFYDFFAPCKKISNNRSVG